MLTIILSNPIPLHSFRKIDINDTPSYTPPYIEIAIPVINPANTGNNLETVLSLRIIF